MSDIGARDTDVGKRCVVTDLRHGTFHPGRIVSMRTDKKLLVEYDDGKLVVVGAGFVKVDVDDA